MSFFYKSLLLFLLLYSTVSFGQERQHTIDSIKLSIQRVKSDTAKARALIQLGDLYYSSDPDSALIFLKEGMALAKSASDQKLIADGNLIEGLAYWAKSDHFSALEYYLLAKEGFESAGDNKGLIRSLMNVGYAHYVLDNHDEAIRYTNEGLQLSLASPRKDSIRIAGFYHNLGLFSEKKEDYSKALEYYFASLRIKGNSTKIDKRSMPRTLDGIAGIYNYMEKYDSALEFYKKGLKIREELDDKIGVFSSSYNLGVVYHGLEQYESARIYYQKALTLAERIENKGFQAYCFDALGELDKKEDNFDRAIRYLKRSLEIREKNPNTSTYAHTLYNISEAFYGAGNTSYALIYTDKFSEVANYASLEDREGVFRLKATIHENEGNYQKSLYALKNAEMIQDSLDEIANSNLLLELKAEYDQDIARREATHIKEKEIQELVVKSKNRFISVLGIGLFFISILLVLLYNSNNQKKKINGQLVDTNSELFDTNKQLENANNELNTVNRQLEVSNNSLQQFTFAASHDLKESLRSVISFSQFLVNKISKGKPTEENKESLTFIVDSGKRMHKTLDDLLNYTNLSTSNESGSEISVGEVIKEVKKILIDEEKVDFSWACEGGADKMKINTNLSKTLFYNIIDNSIKFASEDRPLKIVAHGQRFENQSCLFSFKDNGKGIEEEYLNYIFEPFKRLNNRDLSGSGLGLSVCKKIVDIYGGKIWAESKTKEGTTIYVSFPAL